MNAITETESLKWEFQPYAEIECRAVSERTDAEFTIEAAPEAPWNLFEDGNYVGTYGTIEAAKDAAERRAA